MGAQQVVADVDGFPVSFSALRWALAYGRHAGARMEPPELSLRAALAPSAIERRDAR